MNNGYLEQVRHSLGVQKTSELKTLVETSDLRDLMNEWQALQAEIAETKRRRLAEVDLEFSSELKRIEDEYAAILSLSAR